MSEAYEGLTNTISRMLDEREAEIARLKAEVARLRKLTLTLGMERHVTAMRIADKMHKQQAQATDDYMALLEQLKTARIDALEEAAKSVEYSWGMSVSDVAAAIRALKETK